MFEQIKRQAEETAKNYGVSMYDAVEYILQDNNSVDIPIRLKLMSWAQKRDIAIY